MLIHSKVRYQTRKLLTLASRDLQNLKQQALYRIQDKSEDDRCDATPARISGASGAMSVPLRASVPEAAFAGISEDIEHTRRILSGHAPRPMAGAAVASPSGSAPVQYTHKLSEREALKVGGGQVRIVDSSNFPAATTISATLVEMEPGGMREMHWHTNTDEWQYYLSGRGRMTVYLPYADSTARTSLQINQ